MLVTSSHERRAEYSDLAQLQRIEVSAGALFAKLGMESIANDDPPSLRVLDEYRQSSRLWVSVDAENVPVGFIMLDLVDGQAHIEQVSVHADHAGRRLGQGLLALAARWATAQNMTALSLTTFLNVPWNAPYYERCGFRILDDNEIGPELATLRAHEAAVGLDRWPRVCMGRVIVA